MFKENYGKARKRLIVALDTAEQEQLDYLLTELSAYIDIFKVGLEQYLASRGQVLDQLQQQGKKVFLDLKFHDIPNTMAAAARRAVAEGVWMFNIHVSSLEAMREVQEAAADEAVKRRMPKPLVIAVTVLTSLADNDLIDLAIQPPVAATVLKRASLAKKAGLAGVVSSAQEAKSIKENCGPSFITVCPGVRPDWAQAGDQKRVMTPQAALQQGADYLVVGRPISQAEKPALAAERILKEMEEILC